MDEDSMIYLSLLNFLNILILLSSTDYVSIFLLSLKNILTIILSISGSKMCWWDSPKISILSSMFFSKIRGFCRSFSADLLAMFECISSRPNSHDHNYWQKHFGSGTGDPSYNNLTWRNESITMQFVTRSTVFHSNSIHIAIT